jgi:integrase
MLNVHVYVRHRKSCPHYSKRFYKKCGCPKWVTWHRNGKEHRISAETHDWSVAADKARQIEAKYRGNGTPHLEEQSVEMAVHSYVNDKIAQCLSDATISKLKTTFQKQFIPWCRENRLPLLQDVTLPHLQSWRVTWNCGPLASKKRQERLIGFFYFCQRNRWITDNPALGLSPIRATNPAPQHFTQEEYVKITSAIDRFGKREDQRERLRGMVFLLKWSGLAIQDAVTLERSQLGADDRLILRRTKTDVPVILPMQPQIAHFLRRLLPPNSNERFFFWSGKGKPKSAVANWQRALTRLFELADLKHADGTPKRCHAHMFRHTFAIDMLSKGMPLEDVSRLLGHSSIRTTERYYAPWVKVRADRLEAAVMATW